MSYLKICRELFDFNESKLYRNLFLKEPYPKKYPIKFQKHLNL